ncbi:hypothetical protein EMPG_15327 [Blastomyces silverae]|uniref:Uncharacterized protein n=1 Tax=Blastomyces silverae TaxID=2060906 RepID=A0A0H1BJA6_9EURO|nr:hypothetical protein EMPG_15327 [Blastomyces silverae]
MGFWVGHASCNFHRNCHLSGFAGWPREEQAWRSNQNSHDLDSHDFSDYFRSSGRLLLPNIWHL